MKVNDKQRQQLKDIVCKWNIERDQITIITDQIVNIVERRATYKECPVCECLIPKEQTRCHFCESVI